MRGAAIHLTVALVFFGSAALAQDAENGERLAARWCADCHATGTSAAKARQVMPFAAIAAKPGISSELITNFLMLPHATMPNLPIRKGDAQDIAAFIMQMKR